MLSEARQKKIMEILNRAQKCPILGPQNLGSGGRAPGVPLDPHLQHPVDLSMKLKLYRGDVGLVPRGNQYAFSTASSNYAFHELHTQ